MNIVICLLVIVNTLLLIGLNKNLKDKEQAIYKEMLNLNFAIEEFVKQTIHYTDYHNKHIEDLICTISTQAKRIDRLVEELPKEITVKNVLKLP